MRVIYDNIVKVMDFKESVYKGNLNLTQHPFV